MELQIKNGDYTPDGSGQLERQSGSGAILNRVLYRLTARRGAFPFLPDLGSRLHTVMGEKPSMRQALAAQYVAEALEGEPDLKVIGVDWQEDMGRGQLTVYLEWQGEQLTAALNLT